MGKSDICKLTTLAILSGDVSNTSLSNCGDMRKVYIKSDTFSDVVDGSNESL